MKFNNNLKTISNLTLKNNSKDLFNYDGYERALLLIFGSQYYRMLMIIITIGEPLCIYLHTEKKANRKIN